MWNNNDTRIEAVVWGKRKLIEKHEQRADQTALRGIWDTSDYSHGWILCIRNSFLFLTFLHAHTVINTHINTCTGCRSCWPPSQCPLAPWPPPLTSIRGAIAEKNYTIHFLSLPPFPPPLFLPPYLVPRSLPPSLSVPIHVVTTRKGRRLWPCQ